MHRAMNNLFKIALAMGGSLMLAACTAKEDRFAPGKWELQSWMEVTGRSGRVEPQTTSAKLSPQLADKGAQAAMFSEFYRGIKSGDVTFENGAISGHIDQPAVAPFPAHQQAISGTYSAEAFEMRITMPKVAGVQSYQVVTGKHLRTE
jgi:hypothetical protein